MRFNFEVLLLCRLLTLVKEPQKVPSTTHQRTFRDFSLPAIPWWHL